MNRASSTPDLPTTEDFGWALGVLLRSYGELVAPSLDGIPHGQRGYQALAEIVLGEPPSQLALANRLGLDRTVMTYLVDDLERAGLVERRANPHDRRQRQVVATERGRALLAERCAAVERCEQHLLGALDRDEREVFRRLLRKAAAGGDPPVSPSAVAATRD